MLQLYPPYTRLPQRPWKNPKSKFKLDHCLSTAQFVNRPPDSPTIDYRSFCPHIPMMPPHQDIAAEPEDRTVERGPDEDFSSADDPRPTTLKRRIKITKKPAAAKKNHRLNRIRPSTTRADREVKNPTSSSALGPTRITASPVTTNLNAWLDVRNQLVLIDGKRMPVTPMLEQTETPSTPLGDLPDMPNRDFAFNIQCEDVEVNWDPSEYEEVAPGAFSLIDKRVMMERWYRTIPTWRIYVFNQALPETGQVRLRLFPEYKPTVSRLRVIRQAVHMG